MTKREISLMMKANFGDTSAKDALLEVYDGKLKSNNFYLIILGFFFIVGLYYGGGGGILLWFFVLMAIANRVCLLKQITRVKQIRSGEGEA